MDTSPGMSRIFGFVAELCARETTRRTGAAGTRMMRSAWFPRSGLLLASGIFRRRCLWGVTAWTFKLFRFRKDRLAAMTLQCTLREIRQMHVSARF